jgi:hypothetical protein
VAHQVQDVHAPVEGLQQSGQGGGPAAELLGDLDALECRSPAGEPAGDVDRGERPTAGTVGLDVFGTGDDDQRTQIVLGNGRNRAPVRAAQVPRQQHVGLSRDRGARAGIAQGLPMDRVEPGRRGQVQPHVEPMLTLGPVTRAQEERFDVARPQHHPGQRPAIRRLVDPQPRQLVEIDRERLTGREPVLDVARREVEPQADVEGAAAAVPSQHDLEIAVTEHDAPTVRTRPPRLERAGQALRLPPRPRSPLPPHGTQNHTTTRMSPQHFRLLREFLIRRIFELRCDRETDLPKTTMLDRAIEDGLARIPAPMAAVRAGAPVGDHVDGRLVG